MDSWAGNSGEPGLTVGPRIVELTVGHEQWGVGLGTARSHGGQ